VNASATVVELVTMFLDGDPVVAVDRVHELDLVDRTATLLCAVGILASALLTVEQFGGPCTDHYLKALGLAAAIDDPLQQHLVDAYRRHVEQGETEDGRTD
jgi:hypothetical protein